MSEATIECVDHDSWAPGKKSHQGDLTLVALSKLPKSAKPRSNRQLADGDTRGSRHVVEGGEVFDADLAEIAAMLSEEAGMTVDAKYIGPVFSGACTLTHPQHKHQGFPEHACTAVVYQRNLDAEEREERVLD